MKLAKDECDNDNVSHHQERWSLDYIREIVFGLQDGMVSTLGAITGIAIGSQDHFAIILAGVAIIAVESVSMAIGSYVSSSSEKNVMKRMLYEESVEIELFPEAQREDLLTHFIADGWSEELALQMVEEASDSDSLMLKEMAYRHLSIVPQDEVNPIANGVAMFASYIVGGLVPLLSYFLLDIEQAIITSICVTLIALFGVGAMMTYFTKQNKWRSGLRMLLLGGVALAIGLIVGLVVPATI